MQNVVLFGWFHVADVVDVLVELFEDERNGCYLVLIKLVDFKEGCPEWFQLFVFYELANLLYWAHVLKV